MHLCSAAAPDPRGDVAVVVALDDHAVRAPARRRRPAARWVGGSVFEVLGGSSGARLDVLAMYRMNVTLSSEVADLVSARGATTSRGKHPERLALALFTKTCFPDDNGRSGSSEAHVHRFGTRRPGTR